MKKIIILFSITCISLSAIAQQKVHIGNMEVIIRKQEQDTTMQVNVFEDPCPPCPSENETRPKPKPNFSTYKSSWFTSAGSIYDGGKGYYTTQNDKSINLEIGRMNRYYLTRWFVLGGTLQYSNPD